RPRDRRREELVHAWWPWHFGCDGEQHARGRLLCPEPLHGDVAPESGADNGTDTHADSAGCQPTVDEPAKEPHHQHPGEEVAHGGPSRVDTLHFIAARGPVLIIGHDAR